jgi:hypothetical protein
MTLSALGIFSAAGVSGAVASDYELIESYILGSSQSSITFSSLGTYSSTYKHLQIRAVGRVTDSEFGSGDGINVRFNGDSGANYSNHQLFGTGSSVLSNAASSQNQTILQRFTDAASTANAYGAVVCDILDSFSTTKNKTIRLLGGNANNSSFIFLNSGAWYNTASITSIYLAPNVGTNFATGSRFSLYGIKG